MAYVNPTIIDTALQYVIDNADGLYICDTEPTTYTEALTTYALSSIAIDSGEWTGPAAGDTSGRKITLAAQTGLTNTADGTTAAAGVTDSGNTALLLVFPTSSVTLTNGNICNTTAVDYEIRAAVAE